MTVIKLVEAKPALEPDTVLEEAKGGFESVVVIGFDHEGEIDVRASLNISAATIIFLIERFKLKLLSGDYSDV